MSDVFLINVNTHTHTLSLCAHTKEHFHVSCARRSVWYGLPSLAPYDDESNLLQSISSSLDLLIIFVPKKINVNPQQLDLLCPQQNKVFEDIALGTGGFLGGGGRINGLNGCRMNRRQTK